MASCFFRLVFAPQGFVPRGQDDTDKETPDPTISADIFVCEPGGHPRWCRFCEHIKPDRAHHSRDSGRCVYKMGKNSIPDQAVKFGDHFCPWVGGMIGFTRYKFFLQFVTYAAIFCSFVIASMAPVKTSRDSVLTSAFATTFGRQFRISNNLDHSACPSWIFCYVHDTFLNVHMHYIHL
jgi:palmitoyltransferase